MNVLVADDEVIFRKMVRGVLVRAGHEVIEAAAGDEALSLLTGVEAPPMANAGPQWKSSYDIQPHGGEMGYDDSTWPVIEAKSLADRRGGSPEIDLRVFRPRPPPRRASVDVTGFPPSSPA